MNISKDIFFYCFVVVYLGITIYIPLYIDFILLLLILLNENYSIIYEVSTSNKTLVKYFTNYIFSYVVNLGMSMGIEENSEDKANGVFLWFISKSRLIILTNIIHVVIVIKNIKTFYLLDFLKYTLLFLDIIAIIISLYLKYKSKGFNSGIFSKFVNINRIIFGTLEQPPSPQIIQIKEHKPVKTPINTNIIRHTSSEDIDAEMKKLEK